MATPSEKLAHISLQERCLAAAKFFESAAAFV